jgi:hypothetical protein
VVVADSQGCNTGHWEGEEGITLGSFTLQILSFMYENMSDI